MKAMEVKGLAFSYAGGKKIFEDLSFDVERGQIMCVIGPNGCGKTTLIDCLLGLNSPSAGKVMIAGKDIAHMKPAELASHAAYVPQGHETTFGFTVLDVVTMGRTYAASMFSPPGEEERQIAKDALAQVGLKGFEHRDYTKLSGGELQLVIIARAIAQQAEVLIMDEPTAHLDFRHEMAVMEIIVKLVKEKNISIVMATHFLNQAYYLENAGVDTRVSLMDKGRFAASGTPSEVLTEENLSDTFSIVTEIIKSGKRKYILPLSSGGIDEK